MADTPSQPTDNPAVAPAGAEGPVLVSPYAAGSIPMEAFGVPGAPSGTVADLTLTGTSKEARSRLAGPTVSPFELPPGMAPHSVKCPAVNDITSTQAYRAASGVATTDAGAAAAQTPAVTESTKPAQAPEAVKAGGDQKPDLAKLEPDFSVESADKANLVIKSDGSHEWKNNPIEEGKLKVFVEEGTSKENQLKALNEAGTELKSKGLGELTIPDITKLPDRSKDGSKGGSEEGSEEGSEDGDKGYKDGGGGGGGGGGCDRGGGGGGNGGGGGGGDGDGGGGGGDSSEGEENSSTDNSSSGRSPAVLDRTSDVLRNSGAGIEPNTNRNFALRAMEAMPAGMRAAFNAIPALDADGDGKISPEEQAAYDKAVKNYEQYVKDHPEDVEKFKKDAADISKPLSDAKAGDSAKAMDSFVDKMSKPSENKEFISGITSVTHKSEDKLTKQDFSNNKAFTPEVQKAIADRAIVDLSKTNSLTLDKIPKTEAEKTAVREKQAAIIKELQTVSHVFK